MVPIQTVIQVKLRATQRNVPQDQKPQITHTRRLSVIAEINPEVHCVTLLLPFNSLCLLCKHYCQLTQSTVTKQEYHTYRCKSLA